MEFIDFVEDGEEHDLVIADIELRGVVEVEEAGSGYTERYKAERERESGEEEVDEPPAAKLTVEAYMETETWEEFNVLRERDDPFPVAVGPFVFEMMGIVRLERRVEGEYPEANHVILELQEFREVVVNRSSLNETLGTGQAGGGTGGGGAIGGSPEGPTAAWVDDGTGHDVATGQPIPEMQRESIPPGARPVWTVGSGEAWGRMLFEANPDGRPTVTGNGSGWSIQDVGTAGPSHNYQGSHYGLNPSGGEASLVQNLYLGDGSPNPRGTALWTRPNASGNLIFEYCNGQGWPDNFIYASAPGGSANVSVRDCFAYNNEVASYRLAQGTIRNCVADHDGSHSGRGNRIVWAWSPGPVRVIDCEFRNANGYVLQSGSGGGGGSTIIAEGGNISGSRNRVSGGQINETGVGGSPNLSAYASEIPGSPLDAAAGLSPPGGQ